MPAKDNLDPLHASPDNIWQYAQNKPTLIATDLLKYGVPTKVTYSVLLARGVFKWLSIRRQIIKLKDVWKNRITELQKQISDLKKQPNRTNKEKRTLANMQGQVKAYETCRAEVRTLCHSARWTFPDFDADARNFLLYKQHMHSASKKENKTNGAIGDDTI